MMLIHTAAKLVTRTFEEPTIVGGAAATFSVGGSACVTFRLNVRLDLSGKATTKSLSSLSAELLLKILG